MADVVDGFTIGMPHMAPGRLSEVELLKLLGDAQWTAIARALGRGTAAVAGPDGERLYASFASIDLGFPEARPLWSFGEGDRVELHGRFAAFARRYVEGRFTLDGAAPGAEQPWAHLASTFVARHGGNARLKVVEPLGMAEADLPALAALPAGIVAHQEAAVLGGFSDDPPLPLGPAAEYSWPIVPESDLNGAGLVYFARYVAMMDHAVRRWTCERMGRPVSLPLADALVTERRRVAYFANAEPTDTVRCVVRGGWLDGEVAEVPGNRVRHGRLRFSVDLYRASDGVWMATSTVRKALAVPAVDKATSLEAGRLRAAALGG